MKDHRIKTILFVITATFMLLAGCSYREQPVLPSPEPTPEPTPVRTIMDGAVLLENGLMRIPFDETENGSYIPLENFDGKLLLCGNNGEKQRFTVLDMVTGEVLAQREMDIGEFCYDHQIQGEYLVLSRYESGEMIVLDSNLQTVMEIPEIDMWGSKYINHDLTKIYIDNYEGDMQVIDVETMERSDFGLGETNAYTLRSEGDTLCVNFDRPEDLRQESALVNMGTGTVTINPTGAHVRNLQELDGIWFGNSAADVNSYFISDGIATQRIRAPEMTDLVLDPATGNILGQVSGGGLHVFNQEGKCLSSVMFENMYMSGSAVYSDYWGGYFMSLTDYFNERSLFVFWDMSTPAQCDDLVVAEPHFQTPEGELEWLQELYARAEAMSEKYGMTFLLADQCDTQYTNFGAEQLNDYYTIENALDILDDALSGLPEGFTQQLTCGYIEKIAINLVGNIFVTDGEYGEDTYTGFVDNGGDLCRMALNCYQLDDATVFHELSHIIDSRMEIAENYIGGTEFTYMGWMELQPEDFEYTYSYENYNYNYDYEVDNYYFIDSYSTTFPTEDRARIFEYAASGGYYAFMGCGGLMEKLDYYCRCIRSCFDTTGWPEVTVWEQTLINARAFG